MKRYFLNKPPVKVHRPDHLKRELLLLSLLLLAGCSHFLISYYDPTTYKNLTYLKPKVMNLYETFAGDSVDQNKIAAIRLRLDQMYEYEKGKGPKNAETYRQIEVIKEMFERHVTNRMNNGKWSSTHLRNQQKNMGEAFNLAIQTEKLKNKNE